MSTKRKISVLVKFVFTAFLMMACSSNDFLTEDPKQSNLIQDFTFKIESEEYKVDPMKDMQKTKPKSAKATRTIGEIEKPESIDLGNGLIAELTIEPDTLPSTAQTRAQMSDGHYKIYAVKGNTRLTGSHEWISGTVSGGVFTPDNNKSMRLAHGTYTFVCINDAVTDNGTSLTVKNNAVNAMIGVTTTLINQPQQEISFTMKHMMARIRFQITSYTAAATGATFEMTTDATMAGDEIFDVKGVSISKSAKSFHVTDIPLTVSAPVVYSGIVKPYKVITDYMYFNAGFDTGSIQGGGVKGTLYGKTFNIYPNNWSTSASRITTQKNHSYIFNFTIKTKDPLLLFQDGTVGYYGDRTSARIPVGVVVDEKSSSTDGMAVALKNSPIGIWSNDNTTQANPFMSTDYNTQTADMDGYRYTYEASGNNDGSGKSKAEVAVNGGKYNAFYQAVHYNAGTALTFSGGKTGKWFLPSIGQWKHMLEQLGSPNLSPTAFTLSFGNMFYGNYSESNMSKHFIGVGGELLNSHWLASEYSMQKSVYYMTYDGPIMDKQHYVYMVKDKTINTVVSVRPFIYF